MAISKPSFQTENREQTRYTVIRMLDNKPVAGQILSGSTMGPPGTMAGYYNAQQGHVELYAISPSGNKWLRMR